MLDKALGAGLATAMGLADHIAITLSVSDATADAAGCPGGPIRHDAVFGHWTLLLCIGSGVNSVAGAEAIVLVEEVVAIAATAAIGERFAAIGLRIVRIALVATATGTRFGLLHTNILGHFHVDVTFQWVLAFLLLMQLHTFCAVRLLGFVLQQQQTFTDGNAASTGC